MLKKIISKLFSKNKSQDEVVDNITESKTKRVLGFVNNKLEEAKNELFTMKGKMGNLLETNYQLGLRHIERGNISDAIFRFRFIKKFWPNCYDAYYQLAYCLCLKNRVSEAKKILNELLVKNPDHNKAKDLLNKLF
jgi:TolA-binding protein